MILGDLGADVIKVEPVTGDGMRMVNQPFFGCSARQARHRASTSRAEAGTQIALELVDRADIVHHNMTAGVAEAARHRLRRLQAREPRRRLLQHVGVRARGPARALRRPRPAVPGGGRARVRGRPGARGQRAAVLPLRHDRRRQRDAVGRRLPRRAVPPAPHRRGPGAVDVAARRRRDARVRRAARRRRRACRGPSSTPTRPASTRATASTRRSDGWIQIAAVQPARVRPACARRSGCRSCSTTPRFADRARAPSTASSSRRCSRRASPRRPRSSGRALLDDAGVPNEIPLDTNSGRGRALRRRQRAARARRRVRAPDHRPHAPVRQPHRLLRDAGPHRAARRRSSASTRTRSSPSSATTTRRCRR